MRYSFHIFFSAFLDIEKVQFIIIDKKLPVLFFKHTNIRLQNEQKTKSVFFQIPPSESKKMGTTKVPSLELW